ncbi:hypothetical protein ABBQ32_008557 [Trebouxia sp. C0010 RCD-2024]
MLASTAISDLGLGMAPMRADYNRVALLSCCGETDLLDADVQRVAEENFLVLPKQQCRERPAKLYLREYKTSAQRGVYRRALHPKLTAEIHGLHSFKSHANGYFKAKATNLTVLSNFQNGHARP